MHGSTGRQNRLAKRRTPMAKTNLNTALKDLHGRVDEWVFKQYSYGTVVTRRPRMENVKWSPAQLAHRKRVQESGAFYQAVLADPELKSKYKAIATEKGIPLTAVTLAEYFKLQKPAAE